MTPWLGADLAFLFFFFSSFFLALSISPLRRAGHVNLYTQLFLGVIFPLFLRLYLLANDACTSIISHTLFLCLQRELVALIGGSCVWYPGRTHLPFTRIPLRKNKAYLSLITVPGFAQPHITNCCNPKLIAIRFYSSYLASGSKNRVLILFCPFSMLSRTHRLGFCQAD